MTKSKSDRLTPKRGAIPTPRNVLADATPYKPSDSDEPNKPGPADDQPNSESDSAAKSPEKPGSPNSEKGS
jgi:hypothetical protein